MNVRFVRDITGRDICFECECCEVGNHSILPSGGRIWENDDFVVYSHLSVPLLGFIIVAPKKHIHHFSELAYDKQTDLAIISMRVVDALKKFEISDDFTVLKFEGESEHARVWVMPKLNGIFENDFDFALLENRYSMERRSIPVASAYEILYLNRRMKTAMTTNFVLVDQK